LRERTYDMISDTQLRDVRADISYDPRDLVAQYGW
jgi:hypothetical protein